MRILLYHPVLLPVQQYGGTERVVMWLARTLVKLGHDVAVFAAPGSSMPDGIECLTDPSALLRRASEFDVFHGASRFTPEMEAAIRGKVVITLHGNGQAGERFHKNTIFLSKNHALRHGGNVYVYNGIDPDELDFNEIPRPDRFLYLSKTSLRVKNLRGAIQLASRSKQNLWVAGGDRPYSLKLYTKLQSMRGGDWNWLGSVSQHRKARFLVEGKALVFPLLWNEPFGLVIVEALMSGTPVLANPYGSIPELLEFAPHCILKSEEDWIQALKGGVSLPPAKLCRDWAISKFHQDKMANSYLSLYEKVIAGETLHETEPVTQVLAKDISWTNTSS